MLPLIRCLAVFAVLSIACQARAAGEKLYGVHWWDYDRPTAGTGPDGGWDVETVLTNSDPWQQGWWFDALYQQVKQTHNAEILTRVDYTWNNGHTSVPTSNMMSATDWGNKIVSDIIGPLGRMRTDGSSETNRILSAKATAGHRTKSLPPVTRRFTTRFGR